MEHAPLPRWFNRSSVQFPIIDSDEPDEIIYDLPFEDYLADNTAISNSGLKMLLRSPEDFLGYLMGKSEEEDGEKEKDHYRFGRAVHMAILEPARFRKLNVVMPEFVGMTKDGRPSTRSAEAAEKKAKWLADVDPEALIVTEKEYEDLANMIDSLMRHTVASNLLRNGRPEVTVKWTHKPTGIRMKGRLDYLSFCNGSLYINDIKSTRNSEPGIFSYEIDRNKYHMQLAIYNDAIIQVLKQPVEACSITALDKRFPNPCRLFWLNDEDIEGGRALYEHGMRTLKRCLTTNDWPPPQIEGQMISLPYQSKNEPLPQFAWRTTGE